ncbi:MAG: phosphate acyltransferase PlsX [Planctomycetota bacterium]
MARIAIDAMGGDHAPRVVVQGAKLARERFPDLELTLVGPTDQITAEAKECGLDLAAVQVEHAPEVVAMHESPVEALRKKPNSSLRVMTRLVKEGRCEAAFSAGNTGAMVAATTMGLGLLPGVKRAGILVTFPLGDRPTVLIDAGANIQCKPLHLYQYALMAAEFTTRVYGVTNPKVGLLNVGEEEQKGNQLAKETSELLAQSPLHFIGNIEGGDIFNGECDVAVCDGFVGNIVLKVSEGLSERIIRILHSKVAAIDALTGRQGPIHDSLTSLATLVDYAEYGGAPLLGVAGNVIIGHGRSDAKAVANALRTAREMARARVQESFVEAINR